MRVFSSYEGILELKKLCNNLNFFQTTNIVKPPSCGILFEQYFENLFDIQDYLVFI